MHKQVVERVALGGGQAEECARVLLTYDSWLRGRALQLHTRVHHVRRVQHHARELSMQLAQLRGGEPGLKLLVPQNVNVRV